MLEIGLNHYLLVGAVVFSAGLFCMVTKRNAIGVLIGVELVLNAVNINLVAFGHYAGPAAALDAQIMALFVIVLAAAEAAVAVAICTNFYKNLRTIDVDRGDAVRG